MSLALGSCSVIFIYHRFVSPLLSLDTQKFIMGTFFVCCMANSVHILNVVVSVGLSNLSPLILCSLRCYTILIWNPLSLSLLFSPFTSYLCTFNFSFSDKAVSSGLFVYCDLGWALGLTWEHLSDQQTPDAWVPNMLCGVDHDCLCYCRENVHRSQTALLFMFICGLRNQVALVNKKWVFSH